jgi:hypothetical protein
MENHQITLEQVCLTYSASIASDAYSGYFKRLVIETKITPSNVGIEYVVSTKDKGVIYRDSNIDEAIKRYNTCDLGRSRDPRDV